VQSRPHPDPDSWRFIYGHWHGRLSRRRFWLHGVCILLGLSVLGQALLDIAGVRATRAEAIVNLVLLYPALAVSAKRWQDRDRSSWWVLIGLAPLVGWLWLLLDNGFVRGNPGANRFGAPTQR
jgi:uncharacterized membrane protein YhaH (DUF805 family)